MIYLYDQALADDLRQSFNPTAVKDPVVKVIDADSVVGLAAQIQADEVSYPIVALTRTSDVSIDTERWNFTRLHKGLQSVIDIETNELYYERVIPINLSYQLNVITTNTADMDEIVRELLFKYASMYFLQLVLPYECRRKVRFGVVIDSSSNIERKSSSNDYLASGQLYETAIPLKCEGCVLVTYTPAKLVRVTSEIDADLRSSI